jgi:hypothetical protein
MFNSWFFINLKWNQQEPNSILDSSIVDKRKYLLDKNFPQCISIGKILHKRAMPWEGYQILSDIDFKALCKFCRAFSLVA